MAGTVAEVRIVDVGGRLVEVQVRESPRARLLRTVWRPGEPAELVVPVGTSDRAIDSALRAHAPWLARQLDAERTPVLDPPQLTEREGRKLARELVTETIDAVAPRIGVECRRISIRDTRSRFGSCSSEGSLSFSWRLVLAPRRILDYVVVHELCHLERRDHSPRFWALVERSLPGWRDGQAWLRRHGDEVMAHVPRLH